MGEAILGHDLVTLSALAAAGATQDPDDGEAGGGEGGAVNRLCIGSGKYIEMCQ